MIHPAREESGWVSSGPGDRSSEPQPRRNRATSTSFFPTSPPWNFQESRKKAKEKWPEGARPRGARERCLVATRRGRTRKDMFPRPRADRARFAAKTRRIGEGCRADEEGCSTRSPHLLRWKEEKNGGPTPSLHAAVRRRRTSGLPVKATQVSLAVSRARKGDNRPIRESARTPPTYTPDRFRCAKNYGAGSRTFLPGKAGRS